jgi:transposase
MELLRNRVKQLDQEIVRKLQDHEVGKLPTTIDGIGARAAACLIAELGNPSRFRNAAALASYVGVVPPSATIGQAGILWRARSSARKRAPAPSALDADLDCRAEKPLVACALRPSIGCR